MKQKTKHRSSIESPHPIKVKTNDDKPSTNLSNSNIPHLPPQAPKPSTLTTTESDLRTSERCFSEPTDDTICANIPDSLKIVTSAPAADGRPFPDVWLKLFPWLEYNHATNLMKCIFCSIKKKANKFATGSGRFKIDGPITHSGSQLHLEALQETLQSKFMKSKIDAFWASQHGDLVKLLMHMKFICDENLPISLFASLCAHLRRIGHYYKSSLYMNHYGFMELCQSSSTVIKKGLLESIKKSPFYSLLIDESTDITSTKELAIMIQFYDVHKQISRTEFLCLISLNCFDAKYLRVLILQLLNAYDLSVEFLTGISTDGASVMLGPKKGLCARLIKRAPFAIQNHCIAHRLNLAFKDSEQAIEDKLEGIRELDYLARELYNFFKRSPKRCLDLEKYARINKIRSYKILKVYDIRWLSKFNALDNIRKNLDPLLSLLHKYASDSDKELATNAKALYTKIRKPVLMFCLFLLPDVVVDFVSLLKRFQAENYPLFSLDEDIQSMVRRLELEYIQGDTIRSIAYTDFINKLNDKADFLFRHNIPWSFEINQSCIQSIKNFSLSLVQNIKERFPDRELITSMQIFNLDKILKLREDSDVVDYGKREILRLADHYGKIKTYKKGSKKKDYLPALVCREDLLLEFSHLKYMLYFSHANDDHFKGLRNDQKWAALFTLYDSRFQNLFTIARIVLSIPASTVACERLFSRKNLIKTKTRNSLKTSTTDILLRVGLIDYSEFNSLQKDIIDHFLSMKVRFELKYKRHMEIEGI
jgi:hypothetical protein